jgi:uncharacterized protein
MNLTRLASLHRVSPDTSLLLNALSGAVDLVNNEVRGKLLQLALGGRPALEQGVQSALHERGYLFASRGEERAALHSIHEAYEKLRAQRPLQFVVCPTDACNLACTYCFESADLRARPQIMTSAQVSDLFAATRRISADRPGKQCQIVLFGGEPFLPATETVVAGILSRAGEADLPVYAVTNGTHLGRFADLLRHNRETLRGAQITLDGPAVVHDARRKRADGTGSFYQVVRAVEICLDLGIEVKLRVNLDAQNLNSLESLADLIKEREWATHSGFQCLLAPVTDHLGTSRYPHIMREDELVEPVVGLWDRRPELREVLDFRLFRILDHLISVIEPGQRSWSPPRFHYCEADRGETFTFGPDGLIYACPESMGDSRNAVGIYSPRYRLWSGRLRQWEHRSVLALPECRDCNIATFCGGGCAYAALAQFGSPAHGVCGNAREVVKAYVRTLGGRLQSRGLAAAAM